MTRAGLSLLPTVVLSLSLLGVANADKHGHGTRHHHAQLNRLPTERDDHIGKRFDNARLTFYEAGLGACGQTNTDSDFIVALNSDQYDGGSHCFETITITYNGKSTQAQIADECPGCPYGGLDLTPGLFSYFASTDDGVIYGEWDFGSGAAAATTSPSPTPTPTPTSTYEPPPTTSSTPTTTWTPTTTSMKKKTSSSTPPPTTSSTPSSTWTPSSSSTSSSSATPSSSTESSGAAPSSSSEAPQSSDSATPSSTSASISASASASASVAGGLAGLNQAFVQLAAMAAAAQ